MCEIAHQVTGVSMVNEPEDDGQNLKKLQGALLSTESVEQFLQKVSVLAAGLIDGGILCGMTMQPNGRPVTVACSDQVAAQVDGLHEAQAAVAGIRSCLALPLTADGHPIGAMNLYARTASAFGAAEARRAENFALNASGALTLATRLATNASLIDQLRSSLASRTVIDQALGIIMARERCTQFYAFAILRSYGGVISPSPGPPGGSGRCAPWL